MMRNQKIVPHLWFDTEAELDVILLLFFRM
jgi:hypothetical protein